MTRRNWTNIAMVSAFAAVCLAGISFLAVGLGLEVPGKGGWALAADFEAAEGLVSQADVAIAGVRVGRVVGIHRGRTGGTVVDMRINDDVRLRKDVQAMVRPKSQLGEKYVLLVRNRQSTAPVAPQGYTIPRAQTGAAVEIDDVLQQMDPEARAAFTTTLRQLGVGLDQQAGNVNTSLPPLAGAAASFRPLAQTAQARQENIDRILTDLNTIMKALAEEQEALGQIVDSGNVAFGAMARRDRDLAGTIQQADVLFRSLDMTFADLTPADRASLEKAPPTIRSGRNLLAMTDPDLDRFIPELLLGQVNYPSNQLNVVSPDALALAYEWQSAFAQRDARGHSFRFTNINDLQPPGGTQGAPAGGRPGSAPIPPPGAPAQSAPGGLPGAVQFLIGNSP